MQNSQQGFSIIEILIVLLLISVAGSLIIPTLFNKKQDVIKRQFTANFTTLVSEALYLAVSTKKTHQVYFNFDEKIISIKEHDPSIQDQNFHNQFVFTDQGNSFNYKNISNQLSFKNFYIEGKDELLSDAITHNSWFYIMPDGTSQSVIINIEVLDPPSQFALSVNPFYSQVQSYDSFQKL